MRALALVFAVTAVACTQPPAPRPVAQTVATLIVRDANVLVGDGTVSAIDVAIDEERIVAIGKALVVTRSAVEIDGRGKTLVPAPVDYHDLVEMIEPDPATMAQAIAGARERGKRPVVHAVKLADARAAVEAGAAGLAGVVADAPVDEALLAAAAAHGVFVIATLPDGKAVAPEIVNNVVAMRGRVPVLAGAGREQIARLVSVGGFLPEEAIAAATTVPAQVFGLDDRGRIEVRMRADLLLVDGDPLADIAALDRVVGEWRAGVSAGTP